jgi:putative transposase
MDQTTHEVRLSNWTRIIKQCQNRPSGQIAKQWLAEKNNSDKTYYYWLRRVRIKTMKGDEE